MDRVDGFPVFWLGTTVGMLYSVGMRPGVTLADIAPPVTAANASLEFFCSERMTRLNLSRGAAQDEAENVFTYAQSLIDATVRDIWAEANKAGQHHQPIGTVAASL